MTVALQLAARGKLLKSGDTMDFIFKDSKHLNPFCRTVPYDSSEGSSKTINYDREKYRDLLLDATETMFSSLGFSREAYAYPKNDRKRGCFTSKQEMKI